MKIDFANLQKQYQSHKSEIDCAIQQVLDASNYIMGEQIVSLEKSLQNFCGAKYAVACSSGTDALILSLMAIEIKPDDEVITTPFTFVSTAEVISFVGAIPVFVDIDKDTYNIDVNKIEEQITNKTKAIMPVSLFGQPSDMDMIQQIARKYNLVVLTIPTAIHYPIPLHLQEAYKYLNYQRGDFKEAENLSKKIISLPMNPYLEDDEIKYIAESVCNAI
ncbi:MAG: hypothetical protein COB02_14490 [Candidatus Cloacimonadota bacterium]|nr:MAG: hypothetical protein COB02_14490 [Candidatus Cloacimonadota bacterium]